MMNAVSGQQAGQEQLSTIEKLDKQDKRNKEIARDKTVEDTKKQILEVDMTENKFGADEEKMIYFFLDVYKRQGNGRTNHLAAKHFQIMLYIHTIGRIGNCLLYTSLRSPAFFCSFHNSSVYSSSGT